jgi:hypothetical protein
MTLEYTLRQIGYRDFGDLESNARIFIMDGEWAPREKVSISIHSLTCACHSYAPHRCALGHVDERDLGVNWQRRRAALWQDNRIFRSIRGHL